MDMREKLVLGTVQFGIDYGINNRRGKPSQNEIIAIFNSAYDAGIKTLDTADAYGDVPSLIGKYHQTGCKFSVLGKFKNIPAEQLYDHVLKTSRTMNIDGFTAYSFHSFPDYKEHKYLDVFRKLKAAGLVKKVGISLYTNQEFSEIVESDLFDVIQIPYNMLDNRSQRGSLLEKAEKHKKEIHVRSIFLQGLFFMDGNSLPNNLKPLAKYIEKLLGISRNYDVSISILSLQYALCNNLIAKVLFGVDSQEQLIMNLNAIQHKIPNEALLEIDDIEVKEKELLNPVNWT